MQPDSRNGDNPSVVDLKGRPIPVELDPAAPPAGRPEKTRKRAANSERHFPLVQVFASAGSICLLSAGLAIVVLSALDRSPNLLFGIGLVIDALGIQGTLAAQVAIGIEGLIMAAAGAALGLAQMFGGVQVPRLQHGERLMFLARRRLRSYAPRLALGLLLWALSGFLLWLPWAAGFVQVIGVGYVWSFLWAWLAKGHRPYLLVIDDAKPGGRGNCIIVGGGVWGRHDDICVRPTNLLGARFQGPVIPGRFGFCRLVLNIRLHPSQPAMALHLPSPGPPRAVRDLTRYLSTEFLRALQQLER